MTAKIHILLIFIAEHRIHRINTLVEKTCRSSAKDHVQKRCCHSVGIIFRYGLHRRLDNALLCQVLGISSDNAGHHLPSGLKSFLLQRLFHIHALFFQALRREHEIAERLLLRERPAAKDR